MSISCNEGFMEFEVLKMEDCFERTAGQLTVKSEAFTRVNKKENLQTQYADYGRRNANC